MLHAFFILILYFILQIPAHAHVCNNASTDILVNRARLNVLHSYENEKNFLELVNDMVATLEKTGENYRTGLREKLVTMPATRERVDSFFKLLAQRPAHALFVDDSDIKKFCKISDDERNPNNIAESFKQCRAKLDQQENLMKIKLSNQWDNFILQSAEAPKEMLIHLKDKPEMKEIIDTTLNIYGQYQKARSLRSIYELEQKILTQICNQF